MITGQPGRGFMATKPFEIIAHTADVAVLVRGRDLAELLVHAAQALYAVMFANLVVAAVIERVLTIDSIDNDAVVVDWLNELIYLLDAEQTVFGVFEVLELTAGHAVIRCRGEHLDASRHHRSREVKAATYHMARLRRVPSGYVSRVVFDI
jgi:SHS2 domain-containing protein